MRNAVLILLSLSVGACSIAQGGPDGNPGIPTSAPNPSVIAKLEFSQPNAVEDLDANPATVGRLDCSDDGSIETLIDGYALDNQTTPNDRLALLVIHPNGTVTNLPYRSVPEFANFSMPQSVFVGNSLVYALVNAESKSAKQGVPSRHTLVVAFDKQGFLVRTVVLERELAPLVLGVFPSGNMLLISQNRQNDRMQLRLVSPSGVPIRELALNDDDFVTRAARLPAETRSYSPSFLIGMSRLIASNKNLLLVPLESGLPIVDLDENGVLHSSIPNVPGNMVLEHFLSSGASSWKVQLATVLESKKESLDSQGRTLAIAIRPSERIEEFSRIDGSLLREFDTGREGLEAACEADGAFHFLTSDGQGRLQVATAHVP